MDKFYDHDEFDFNDTTEIVSNLLRECKYYDSKTLPYKKFHGTSFFFNNIDGFQSNFDEFLAQSINFETNFDFYCFCETNVRSDQISDKYSIGNYESEFLPSIEGKAKGSGLAIYYRKSMKFNRDKFLTVRNEYFECLGGKLKCDIGDIYVLVIYRFIKNDTKNCLEYINNLLKKVSEKPTIILGDFNFDILKCDEVASTQKYIDTLMSTGFVPLISKPTHIKGSSTSSIDKIWTNIISESMFSGILDNSTSGHLPVFATVATSAESMFMENDNTNESNTQLHNINLKNIEKFQCALNEFNTRLNSSIVFQDNNEIDPTECKEQFNCYYNELHSIYDECFLENVELKSKRNFFHKPWITLGIAKSCEVKNHLHRIKVR